MYRKKRNKGTMLSHKGIFWATAVYPSLWSVFVQAPHRGAGEAG